MNYEHTLVNLQKWQTDESFFRDYYQAVKEGREADEILARPEVSDADKQYALNPDTIDPQMTETRFFAEGRNVQLIKHPRYFPFFEHKHAFFEMLYVIEGHCEQVINGKTQHLEAGDLCLLAPNIEHGIRVFDSSIVINILIRHSTFEDIFLHAIRDRSRLSLFFLGNLFENSAIRALLYRTENEETLRNYILDMYAEQTMSDSFSDRIICSLLTIFFAQLTRKYTPFDEMSALKEKKSPYADEMIAYILDHYQTVTLNDLADHFHFAVPYCSKLVKTITGSSFSDLITRIRLQRGENLLSHTQTPIAEIAEMIGYKNPETFIRAFERIYGMSPSQYRRSSLLPQAEM